MRRVRVEVRLKELELQTKPKQCHGTDLSEKRDAGGERGERTMGTTSGRISRRANVDWPQRRPLPSGPQWLPSSFAVMFHLQADVVRAVLHPAHFPADAVRADRAAKSYVGSFAFRR